jgi:hypothetical protein
MRENPTRMGYSLVSLVAFVAAASTYRWRWWSRLAATAVSLQHQPTRDDLSNQYDDYAYRWSFHGIPVTHQDGPPRHSTTHCIGESFLDTSSSSSWIVRSCQFRHVCFDTSRYEFVLFPSPTEEALAVLLLNAAEKHKNSNVTGFSTYYVASVALPHSSNVSLGAIDPAGTLPHANSNGDTVHDGLPWYRRHDHLSWFPTIRSTTNTRGGPDERSASTSAGYYQLPESHVLVPFSPTVPVSEHSIQQVDFLSIFALLQQFGLEQNKQMVLVLLRPNPRGHKNTDQWLSHEDVLLFVKYLPTMGISATPADFFTDSDVPAIVLGRTAATSGGVVVGADENKRPVPPSTLVCAAWGAAGPGLLMTPQAPVRQHDKWTYTHAMGHEATRRAYYEFTEAHKRRDATGAAVPS